MTASLVLVAVVLLGGGGLFCMVTGRHGSLANHLGPGVSVIGGIPALAASVQILRTGGEDSLQAGWDIPFGSFSLAVDPLSGYFMLAISTICILCAIYGYGYLKEETDKRPPGASWFFFNVLFASMLLVVTARNGMLFLVAWELMSLASFFLVISEHEHASVRHAGWIYLVATHVGTAFLLVLFALLGNGNGTWDFASFSVPGSSSTAGILFLLALVGFGTKSGFLPMHVWLPEAHPAAPSHVSAVMSAVMIKTGIYGLLRILTFLGMPPTWWGWTLIGLGVVSGVIGVLTALAQHDLKRLLAYHSVENIGIICMGLGLGLLGISLGNPVLAVLGLAGGLLHVWNHALFKSLLFMGAGAVAHATGTRNVEELGGLLKKMPVTGTTFLIASAAICGLPPLNGFVSELLIYVSSFSGVAYARNMTPTALAGLVTITSLALIGGLAAACFAKAFGIVFLGEPRTPQAAQAHEITVSLRFPMISLALLCTAVGLFGAFVLRAMAPVLQCLLGENAWLDAGPQITSACGLLRNAAFAGTGLILLVAVLAITRRCLLAGRRVETTGTWDCGYAAPSARMQYTASSFAWPIITMFKRILCPSVHVSEPKDLFPSRADLETHTPDVFLRYGYRPLFLAVDWCSARLRWIQQGRNQFYVLYIALVLLILLAWKLGTGQ